MYLTIMCTATRKEEYKVRSICNTLKTLFGNTFIQNYEFDVDVTPKIIDT